MTVDSMVTLSNNRPIKKDKSKIPWTKLTPSHLSKSQLDSSLTVITMINSLKDKKTLLQLDDDEDTNNRNRESQLSDNMKQAFHPFEPRRDSYVQWNIDDGVKK